MDIIYYTTLPPLEYYFQPKTVSDAVSLLVSYGEEAKILAGGTDLLVLMRSRALRPECIIDITRVPGLDYISYHDEDGLRIGALATLRAVELSKVVKDKYLVLYEAVQQMGSTQVKNMGTVVGNLCRASPAADTAPPLLVLEAEVRIAGPIETRTVPLEGFFIGPGQTVLEYYEMVTEIIVPGLPAGTGMAFLRATRVAADLAKVNVAAAVTVKNGACEDARIALGGVAPTPIRARKAEEVLKGEKLGDGVVQEAAEIAATEIRPIDDLRSSAEYRQELSKVLVRRAIRLSQQRAQGAPGR
jgi:CO/xanthine dehydrogenase FAD-binding subunit